jgi:hypothetical protein
LIRRHQNLRIACEITANRRTVTAREKVACRILRVERREFLQQSERIVGTAAERGRDDETPLEVELFGGVGDEGALDRDEIVGSGSVVPRAEFCFGLVLPLLHARVGSVLVDLLAPDDFVRLHGSRSGATKSRCRECRECREQGDGEASGGERRHMIHSVAKARRRVARWVATIVTFRRGAAYP